MAKRLQHRGGTTSQHSTFTGAVREVTVDTDKNTLVVHDGATAGGHPLATATNFQSTGIDDNATSTALTINGANNATFSGIVTADEFNLSTSGDIHTGSTASQITIAGGTNSNVGSNVSFYGSTHASLANVVRFRANASETMRIDSSGNVGIGTTNPIGLVNIVQASNTQALLRLRNNTADTSAADGMIFTITDSSSPVGSIEMISGANDAKLAFRTNGAERMRIASGGNVGIGTTSPSELLHLSSTTNAEPTILIETVNDGANGGRLDFLHKSASPADGDLLGDITFGGYTDSGTPPSDFSRYVMMKAFAEDVSDGAEKGRLTFSIHSGASNENNVDVLTLNGTNVGIGTTSPDSLLHIDGTNPKITVGTSGSNVTFLQRVSDDFYIFNRESAGNLLLGTADTERMRIDSTGKVGIGTTNPIGLVNIVQASNTQALLRLRNNTADTSAADGMIFTITDSSAPVGSIEMVSGGSDAILAFRTNGAERMRIDSSGQVLISKTSSSLGVAGFNFNSADSLECIRSGGEGLKVNRLTNDGQLVNFYQDSTQEGSISVSGTTINYNGFTGTHWSRFTDNSKPTILRGTVLETLDEMCDWYNLEFDITTTTQDEDGNDVTNTVTEKVPHVLADGQSDGDVITYNHEGTDYQATIVKEADIKHMKSKVSDTVDAKNVYGVFSAYDLDGEGYNDFYVASVGSFVVRIKANETIAKGDLLQSNGDGTAKVQTDDNVKSSSFAKVLSTTVIETYEDGSYLVPCSLMC